MAILFERTIRSKDLEYRVIAGLDDAAIMEDQLRLSVAGSVRHLPNGEWREETIDLLVDLGRSVIEVRVRDRPIATVPLTSPLPDITDFLGNGSDISADDMILDGELGTAAIEELIHLIPTDPFFGCIVKGAISTAIGQTIRCWRTTRREAPISQRIRDIGGCLREYGLRMALTFMYRVGRCAAFAGLH